MSAKLITASLAVLLVTSAMVIAKEEKFDKRVQKAATDIAAAQLGSIRGTIDYDEVPVFVESANAIETKLEPSTSPRPAWVPDSKKDALPPMTQHVEGIDTTSTGSIKPATASKQLPQLWDRFDKHGNRIDRYGNLLD